MLGGALAANFSVANAYVADITTPEKRAKSFGRIGAAFGIGFIVGPAIGGTLGGIDIRLPFYAAAALSLVNAVYGLLVLPESLPRERRKAIEWRKANPFSSLAGLARLKSVGVLVVVIGLVTLAQFILHGTWVLYTGFPLRLGSAGERPVAVRRRPGERGDAGPAARLAAQADRRAAPRRGRDGVRPVRVHALRTGDRTAG